ncbi:MAG: PIN domain-containing protein [Sedimentisphaerales bacterium]|nr:PIN domain-containing protein [Sedimentisphaerales bacterium]
MVIWIVRAVFVLLVFSLLVSGFSEGGPFNFRDPSTFTLSKTIAFIGCSAIAVLGLCIDLLVKRKNLAALAGLFFGLIVGLLVGLGLNKILDFAYETYSISPDSDLGVAQDGIKFIINVFCSYLAIVFVMQTKDDFRFIVPYVEFSKVTKGMCPLILDTSVIIDGRIADIAATGIIHSPMIVPRFVLKELQQVADSADRLKRNRGRRGLDMLNKMQSDTKRDIKIEDIALNAAEQAEPVDQQLVAAAIKVQGKILTNDYNLNKVASLRGVEVININDLANAIKPVVLPGEAMTVKIVKPGDQMGQGVGYLDDGTMIVVEQGRNYIGKNLDILVTSVLQTSAGRMIFGKPDEENSNGRNSRSDSNRPNSG